MNRQEISKLIKQRINVIGINFLTKKYQNSGLINHLVIDDLLPSEIASQFNDDFPKEQELNHLNKLSENKYVGINENFLSDIN